ncbi:MAG: cell division protein ZapA [Bacteroides sp.]|nr:cell division protein ZapA [Bacteroidales bacterium]MBD5326297.1 cell division protein ZapA [Bacteroides sp.]MDE6223441.1 cell division protein ZapA [Muribaculaceae bacterium]MBD5415885.1 cell division protein ZapA [Bacteroides sp.]MBD5425574.1 cell division protein ZapA [Bacteroides sp.]
MADKQNITIQLAGQPKIPLAVERSDEELARRAEKMVNDLWHRWATQTFAAEPQLKVMARVAFQFAMLYLRNERSADELTKLNDELNNLVKNLPGLEQH